MPNSTSLETELLEGLTPTERKSATKIMTQGVIYFDAPSNGGRSTANDVYAALKSEAASLVMEWAKTHRPDCLED